MSDKKDVEIEKVELAKLETPTLDLPNVTEGKEFSMEEMMASISIPPIELNIENLTGVKYDKKEFQLGLNSMSKSAGILTGLINSGLSSAQAVDYLINCETIEMNLALNKENNRTSIEISKNTNVQFEKNQL